jgi:hypothetical protein
LTGAVSDLCHLCRVRDQGTVTNTTFLTFVVQKTRFPLSFPCRSELDLTSFFRSTREADQHTKTKELSSHKMRERLESNKQLGDEADIRNLGSGTGEVDPGHPQIFTCGF